MGTAPAGSKGRWTRIQGIPLSLRRNRDRPEKNIPIPTSTYTFSIGSLPNFFNLNGKLSKGEQKDRRRFFAPASRSGRIFNGLLARGPKSGFILLRFWRVLSSQPDPFARSRRARIYAPAP